MSDCVSLSSIPCSSAPLHHWHHRECRSGGTAGGCPGNSGVALGHAEGQRKGLFASRFNNVMTIGVYNNIMLCVNVSMTTHVFIYM